MREEIEESDKGGHFETEMDEVQTKDVSDEGGAYIEVEYVSSFKQNGIRSMEERRIARQQKRKTKQGETERSKKSSALDTAMSDRHASELLSRNEDELLEFVAKINKVYQEKLKKPAPFMTFVFCGMQSAGKSTIMERFMNAVLNIVQEGTGTRCPLDTTCIHDASLTEPVCELSGDELDSGMHGDNLTVGKVFDCITTINKRLGDEDRFSTNPIYLIYRAKNVQNMRFVDTPGIISNKSTGKDNRDDIKTILRSEMRKPNTKLCVLLEPKEFQTNPIVDFCDSSFGGREKWINSATFLMTKFDKQLEDSRAASKANLFFNEFHKNKCFPHLVITPTLAKENLPGPQLFKARRELLNSADQYESERFGAWIAGHEAFYLEHQDELLNPEITKKIGFPTAKRVMREIMLADTAKRLPEVLASLRKELSDGRKELEVLEEKQKFSHPRELKIVVSNMFFHIERRILAYLNGDLESALKFPERLKTLDEEIEAEEESDWATKKLNFFTEREDHWRDRIADMDEYPEELQAESNFLGGKQYHRAIEFFRAVMVEALPDPYQLKDKIANVTGYLSDGLQRENWEHAMVEIIRVCVKDVSHPGINYLIKHVGSIFRRLFTLALADIKQGERFSATFQMIPIAVERFLTSEFDAMLWNLMQEASDQTHGSLEPMYSTIDPNLPTFRSTSTWKMDKEPKYVLRDGKYIIVSNNNEDQKETLKDWMWRIVAFNAVSGKEAKKLLKKESRENAFKKKSFLPDERSAMITGDEIDTILRRAFEYIIAVMDYNLTILKFHLNHYLFEGFKQQLKGPFTTRINNADWNALVQPDPEVNKRIETVRDQIVSIENSLKDVEGMNRRM